MDSILLFGGSFNPVHKGHVKLVKTAGAVLSPSLILIVPTATPPHKPANELIGNEHRFNMLKLAFGGDKAVLVSDMELVRGGLSYTSDTIDEVKMRFNPLNLQLLMGADMFLTVKSWHKAGHILKNAEICAVAREHGEYERLLNFAEELTREGSRVKIIRTEPFPVSSTQIRGMIREGEPVDGLLPDGVPGYIKDNHLYVSNRG